VWKNRTTQGSKLIDGPNGKSFFYQPQNSEIFKQIETFNKALENFISTQPKDVADLKFSNINLMKENERKSIYELLSLLGTITQMAITEIPQLKIKYPELQQKTFLEIAKKTDYIKKFVITYVSLYTAIRDGDSYGFDRSKVSQSIQGVTFQKDPTVSNVKTYYDLFYQEGTVQYGLRENYNKLCRENFDSEASECLDLDQKTWEKRERGTLFTLTSISIVPAKAS
jgi:hypothetical protein